MINQALRKTSDYANLWIWETFKFDYLKRFESYVIIRKLNKPLITPSNPNSSHKTEFPEEIYFYFHTQNVYSFKLSIDSRIFLVDNLSIAFF